ncbi:MAG: RICIN domain-containing protein [Lachnospiraceae bacterium]|jgi:beta-lactamase superfamily II metal-dependent hydrolase
MKFKSVICNFAVILILALLTPSNVFADSFYTENAQEDSSAALNDTEVTSSAYKSSFDEVFCENKEEVTEDSGSDFSVSDDSVSMTEQLAAPFDGYIELDIDESAYYRLFSAVGEELVLAVSNSSKNNSANVCISKNSNNQGQWFSISQNDDGTYTFINVNSGKVLDVYAGSKENFANVQQYNSNGTDAQRWYAFDAGEGYTEFVNKASGKALDVYGGAGVSGANVQQYSRNSSAAQKWKINAVPENYYSVVPTELELEENVYYEIRSSLDSKKVISADSCGIINKTNIQISDKTGAPAEWFTFTKHEDGSYTIFQVQSGKVLDVSAGSVSDLANVQLYSYNGSDAQKWYFCDAGDGLFEIINKKSGKALDLFAASTVSGTNIDQYSRNFSKAQKWSLKKAAVPASGLDGLYTIASSMGSSKRVVDVSAGSLTNCANIQLYTSNDSNAQKFSFINNGDGTYSVRNLKSFKVLDVEYASNANGGNVWQYIYNGSNAQKWIITVNSDGTYSFFNKNSGKAMDCTAGKDANGTNIDQYTSNSTPAQKWHLIETTCPQLSKSEDGWTFIQLKDNSGIQSVCHLLYNNETGSLVVIDGGMTANASNLREYINIFGGHVDAWFISHFHWDHSDALTSILGNPEGITIDNIYVENIDPDDYAGTSINLAVLKRFLAASKGLDNIVYPERDQVIQIDDLTVTVLNTYDDLIFEYAEPSFPDDIFNDASLVLKVETQNESILFLSDVEHQTAIDFLVDRYGDEMKADYVVCAHHGNTRKIDKSFYDFVGAHTAIINAPDWLINGSQYDVKNLIDYFNEKGTDIFVFNTAPNYFILH